MTRIVGIVEVAMIEWLGLDPLMFCYIGFLWLVIYGALLSLETKR
jgi:hypothetical protein